MHFMTIFSFFFCFSISIKSKFCSSSGQISGKIAALVSVFNNDKIYYFTESLTAVPQ